MNKKYMELQKKTREANKKLVEAWSKVLDHKSMPPIEDSWKRMNTARVLEQTRKYLNETTFSGDISQFAPILIPMMRRMLPQLVAANELIGTQPMGGPVGLIFGLRYGYAGENKTDPNMHSHYLDQGRVFKFRKTKTDDYGLLGAGGLDKQISTATNGDAIYEGISTNSDYYPFQPYSTVNKHNFSVGDVFIATATSVTYNSGTSQWETSTVAFDPVSHANELYGAWKIISIIDSLDFHIFLTVAFPIGTLEHSATWEKRFRLAGDSDYDKQRNLDYKSGFYKRSVDSELNELTKEDLKLWVCRDKVGQDPFKVIQAEDDNSKYTLGYGSAPYSVYAKSFDIMRTTPLASLNSVDAGAPNSTLTPTTESPILTFNYSELNRKSLKSQLQYVHPAEVGYTEIYANYSGPYTTHEGEMLGINQNRRKLGLYVEKQSVEARTRWLQAQYSVESEQDLRAMHNIDLNSEFMTALNYELMQEIDRELIEKMFYLAESNQTDTIAPSYVHIDQSYLNQNLRSYDASIPTPLDGRLVDTYRRFVNLILRMSNGIGKDTGRGTANWILCSPSASVIFESMQNFNSTNITGDVNSGDYKIGLIGTINGNIKVYKDMLSDRDKDFVLLGYKGDSPYDAGIFYCPYIPIQIEQTQGEQSFEKVIGFQSRYAIAENLFGAEKYYRLLEIDSDVLSQI